MNNVQLFFMWVGIIVLIFYGILMLGSIGTPMNFAPGSVLFGNAAQLFAEFLMGSIVWLAIICGFIITFKDRKPKRKHE